MAEKKKCFVVMGFGKKTDYATGRVLDLDKSYNNIIKPAAEAAGLECCRADEIIHAGTIDVPMYEQLLTAHVVIADISTSNANALYELGVRHALKPFTTITIAEDKMVLPFDTNHVLVRTYRHLGEDIGYSEVLRMQNELKRAIQVLAGRPSNDSPVYTFLKNLRPPELQTTPPMPPAAPGGAVLGKAASSEAPNPTVSALMTQAETAMQNGDFVTARTLLNAVRTIMPKERYVAQKLALATYKSKVPTPMQALEDARAILNSLQPDVSTDTETLGLWGAVHKRLWDLTEDPNNLDAAIHAYEKGFFVKKDYYNGINLAFLFNVRATRSDAANAIADFMIARRKRREVIAICEGLLESGAAPENTYWILATLAEAWFGLEEKERAQQYLDRAFQIDPPPASWMKESTLTQLKTLEKLLEISPLRYVVSTESQGESGSDATKQPTAPEPTEGEKVAAVLAKGLDKDLPVGPPASFKRKEPQESE